MFETIDFQHFTELLLCAFLVFSIQILIYVDCPMVDPLSLSSLNEFLPPVLIPFTRDCVSSACRCSLQVNCILHRTSSIFSGRACDKAIKICRGCDCAVESKDDREVAWRSAGIPGARPHLVNLVLSFLSPSLRSRIAILARQLGLPSACPFFLR